MGCLVAVAGGVWIGANYVGLDLNRTAYQALDETELLTQIPEDWRPPNPDCPDGDCPDPEEVRLLERARLQSQLEQLRSEVAQFSEASAEAPSDPRLSEEDRAVRDRTHAIWVELAGVVREVNNLQEQVAPFMGTEQHSRALAARRRALDYGGQAIAALDLSGIDAEAAATAVRVAEWLAQSSETLKTAVGLKGRQAIEGRAVTAAEVWAQTEAELLKRTELVRRRSAETSAYLTNRYLSEFPALGI